MISERIKFASMWIVCWKLVWIKKENITFIKSNSVVFSFIKDFTVLSYIRFELFNCLQYRYNISSHLNIIQLK